jgi:hypothetical protein
MAGPITLRAGAYPAVADGLEGFVELTEAEIKNQVAGEITLKFATDTDGSGTAELNVVTGGSAGSDEIGTFTNRERTEAVGVHPAGGSTTDTVYRFNQPSGAVSESGQINPLRWTDDSIEQCTDTELDTEILDHCIEAMVLEDANTVGQYKIDTSSPSGGTWTSRYVVAETQVDGTDVNYTLWQKTAPTTDAGTNEHILLKVDTDTGSVTEMTEANLHTLVPAFRNRIMATGVGTYLLQASTPSVTGTWVQMGGTMTDQLKDITSANYAGDYTGSYTGYYDRFFGGFLNGAYAGTYSGTYTGYYAGNTVQSTSSTQETKQLFVRTA